MEAVFLKLLNMSIAASWLVLAVVLLRLLLKKAPKAIRCILWALVGVRLIWPFSIESVLSLIPSAETVPQDIVYSAEPSIHTGIPAFNAVVNPIISEELAPNYFELISPMQIIVFAASILWIVGMAAMIVYTLVSYFSIRRKVKEAARLYENVWVCDRVDTPFILGVFRPRIFLPSAMKEPDMDYVIAHEKAHLKRRDHWWKPLGFALLTVYWFNPVLWLAYLLLCRDIELACDEKVVRELGNDCKKPYSEALINCSVPRRSIAACPLAFGETGVQGRIRSVLHYKKPAFWVIIAAVLSCIVVALCFLTDPKPEQPTELGVLVTASGTTCPDVEFNVLETGVLEEDSYIKAQLVNKQEKSVSYGEEFFLYRGKEELTAGAAWNLPGYSLKGYGSVDLEFNLTRFNATVPGKYRLEKVFEIPNDGNPRYTAYIEFEIAEQYAIAGKAYEGERLVYSDGMYSSVFYDNNHMLQFMVTEDLRLLTDERFDPDAYEQQWTELGTLRPVDLNEDNFYPLLTSLTWEDGYSAKNLRKENYFAWVAKNEDKNRLSYLLLQENGDVYICYGYTDRNTLRWVFKMRQAGTNDDAAVGGAEWKEQAAVYTYKDSPDPVGPRLSLREEDQTFSLTFSLLSSYVALGTYELTDTRLILTTDQLYEQTYVFKRAGDRFIFDASKSQSVPRFKYDPDGEYQSPMPDGAVFELINE